MKRLLILLLCMLMALALIGCAPVPPPAAPAVTAGMEPAASENAAPASVALTDMLGRSVYVHGTPSRIVSLCPTVTELLFSLNRGDSVVGVDTNSDYPADVMGVSKMGEADAPNVEAIYAAAPDVVFVGNDTSEESLALLEAADLSVVYAEAVSYTDIFASIALIAQITGADATDFITEMQFAIADVERMAGFLDEQTVLYISAVDDAGIRSVNRSHYISTLIEMAGGAPVVTDTETILPAYSASDITAWNPQVILMSSAVDMSTLNADPALAALAAVQQGRVFTLDAELISRPGSRIVDGLEQIYDALEQAQNS